MLGLQVKYQQKHPKIYSLAALFENRTAQIMSARSSLTLQSLRVALWNTPLQQCPLNSTSTEEWKQTLHVWGVSVFRVCTFPKGDQAIQTVGVWLFLLGLLVASLNGLLSLSSFYACLLAIGRVMKNGINRPTPSSSPKKPLGSICVYAELLSAGNS